MKVRLRESAFTLVELLVTVSLLALLVVAALPNTGGWMTSARIHETGTALQQAITAAKTRALSNPHGITGPGNPVAVICQKAGWLEVRAVKTELALGQNPCDAIHSDQLWRTALRSAVKLEHGADDAHMHTLSYLFFDNQGRLVTNFCPERFRCASQPRIQVASADAKNQTEPLIMSDF